MARVDVVVAVRNEEETLPVFLADIEALALPEGVSLRVVFVEDSSDDGTRSLLRRVCEENPAVAYYALARGFGQGPAVVFGMSRSRADAIVMMDADGSHPPAAIPELIRAFQAGARVVQCTRHTAPARSLQRRAGAAVFERVARALTGVDLAEQNVYYRLVAAEVARELLARPQYWRFLRFPLPRAPGALVRVAVDAPDRQLGESKYDLLRLMRLGLDGILSLMPGARFATLAVALGLLAGGLAAAGAGLLAAATGAAAAGLIARYLSLGRGDPLARMRVAEASPGAE